MNAQLKLLLIATFFNCLAWIILIPIWHYPDEQAHFAQVQDLAELGKVPTNSFDASYEIAFSEQILGTQRDGFGNNKFTYHREYKIEYSNNLFGPQESAIEKLPQSTRIQLVQREATVNPPLYYHLGEFAYKLVYKSNLFVRVYAVRLLSTVLFLITIIIAYRTGLLVFDKSKGLALALATLLAFKPMLIFSSTGVLPDVLTNLFFSLIIYFSLKILMEGFVLKNILAISVVLALLSFTRQQSQIALPIIAMAIFYQLYSNRKRLNILLKPVLIFASALTLFSLFIPNFRSVIVFAAPEIGHPNLSLLFTAAFVDHFIWTVRHTIAEVLPWYWGVYRWLSFTLPPFYYQLINRIIVVALLGILIRYVFIAIQKKFNREDQILTFLIIASVIYFLVLLIWDYYFTLQHGFSFGIQGRYYFPLVIAHFMILLAGLLQIFKLIIKRYLKYALIFLVFLMIIFNNASLIHIAASYYKMTELDIFVKQASQYKPIFLKGNSIFIILASSLFFQIIFIQSLFRFFKQYKSQDF